MNVNEHVFGDIYTYGDGEMPSCTGFIPDAFPEAQKPILAESIHTGVSTQKGLYRTIPKVTKKQLSKNNWYVFRVTYGREQSVYDYLVSKKIEAFYPTKTTVKLIDGKIKHVIESRLPNISFARGTEEEIKFYVYDNVNLPHFRFYYHHLHKGEQIIKKPLIVPDKQMEASRLFVHPKQRISSLFRLMSTNSGQARWYESLMEVSRVSLDRLLVTKDSNGAVIIDGLLTIATAYIPSAFMVILK